MAINTMSDEEFTELFASEAKQLGRTEAIKQCTGILLGEVGRLRKIQIKNGFEAIRGAEINKLYQMATKLRKLK